MANIKMTHSEKQERYNITVAWPKLKKWIDGHKKAGFTQKGEELIVFVNARNIFRKSCYTLAKFRCINPDMHNEPMVYILVTAYGVHQDITLVGQKYSRVLVGPKAQHKDLFAVMSQTYKVFR